MDEPTFFQFASRPTDRPFWHVSFERPRPRWTDTHRCVSVPIMGTERDLTQEVFRPPEIDEPVARPEQQSLAFHSVSTQKLFIMSVLTFGIYDLAYWWKQWSAQKAQGRDIWRFWRTVFAPIWSFGFAHDLRAAAHEREVPVRRMVEGAGAANLYLLARVGQNLVDRLAPIGVSVFTTAILSFVAAYALTSFQEQVNDILVKEGVRTPINRGFTAAAGVIGVIGALLWLFNIVALTGILPVE